MWAPPTTLTLALSQRARVNNKALRKARWQSRPGSVRTEYGTLNAQRLTLNAEV